MSTAEYEVIRDTREKENQGWIFPAKSPCKGTVIQKLATADYTLKGFENALAIERKATTSEIATNLTQDRFDRELERLQEFKYAFIVCEFMLEDVIKFPLNSGVPEKLQSRIRVTPQFILKRLNEIQIKYGIHLIFAGRYGREFCSSLFKRIIENDQEHRTA